MPSLFNSHGVLGLNARNLLYVDPYNPRAAKAFADDKIKTKAYLSARGVPTAKVYARINNREELRTFDFASLPDHCVLKPNYGYGGEGILILKGRRNGEFLENGKKPMTEQRMREHIQDILEGKFSVNGRRDTAFFEKILVPDPCFMPFRPAGLPDIRIIVFNLVPVMAMLRVPTSQSGGKANVHQGGLGIGIDLAKGVTTYATQYNRMVQVLPHGGSPSGHAIPQWEEMLLIASRIQQLTSIGYLAVDLTVDAEQGPVLLEVNARAGLMVQVANLAPLRTRLERVKGIRVSTPEKGVRLARDLFGERHRMEGADADDRTMLGVRELLTVHGAAGNVDVLAAIVPALTERTMLSPAALERLRAADAVDQGDDGAVRVKFTLGGRKVQTAVLVHELPLPGVEALVGRRDLQGFLIDPSRTVAHVPVPLRVRVDLRAVDRIIGQVDQDLQLLTALKPLNLQAERLKADRNPHYEPQFQYPDVPDLTGAEERLRGLAIDDTPLGELFRRKRDELLLRSALIQARGDSQQFTVLSGLLFGTPDETLLGLARQAFHARLACDLPPLPQDMLRADQACEHFSQALSDHGLFDWQAVVRDTLIADCSVGWKRVFIRRDTTFSREDITSLIAHEIETHAFTLENGARQPYAIFRRGFAQYLQTQEGLAVWNQNRVLGPHADKRYGPPRSVLAVHYGLQHGFAETRQYLTDQLGYPPAKALTKAIEIKRGLSDTRALGGFTKGIVYFRGFLSVEEFLRSGGDVRRLYVGKVALRDLDLIDLIPDLVAPQFVPSFEIHRSS